MASKELQAKFENYEEYIKKKGIDEKVIDEYGVKWLNDYLA